jgi:hypothetical protein
VGIFKDAFHHFDNFSTFMSAVFYLMNPKSHKFNAVRILKDPFDHIGTFSQFSEEF